MSGVDWSQIWYPGPTRIFTAEELARAGADRPGRTLQTAVLFNYALLGFMLMQVAPPVATAALTLVLAVAGLVGWFGALALWRRPSRRTLALWSLAGAALLVAATIGTVELKHLARGSTPRTWVVATGMVLALLVSIGWWFVAVHRAQQVEARLREQAEQARALAMAGQLAAAQIQPHFLFNSLASLQHWVQAKDDRAAPMLAALTGFLRATLPLFNRPRLALGEEAEAVHQFLDVMRLRLGERLRYTLEVDPQAAAAQVPPGLLLTLVENAVEHGVSPALAGAAIEVLASTAGDRVTLSVQNSGPGLAPGATDGVGLANSRRRLEQAFGAGAALTLENAAAGGCIARISFPLETA
jgi:hypothetical protein